MLNSAHISARDGGWRLIDVCFSLKDINDPLCRPPNPNSPGITDSY